MKSSDPCCWDGETGASRRDSGPLLILESTRSTGCSPGSWELQGLYATIEDRVWQLAEVDASGSEGTRKHPSDPSLAFSGWKI